jgi:hypothetical protein
MNCLSLVILGLVVITLFSTGHPFLGICVALVMLVYGGRTLK